MRFLYSKSLKLYCDGMANYARLNNCPDSRGEIVELDFFNVAVVTEAKELGHAIKSLNLAEIFLEFFDVMHSLTKWAIISILPYRFLKNPITWLPMGLVFIPVVIKFANRMEKDQCIRNHKNPSNNNHRCKYFGFK
jgi:hypothetical protein